MRAALRRAGAALFHRSLGRAFRAWRDARAAAAEARARLRVFCARLARRALWLSLRTWVRRHRGVAALADEAARAAARVVLHWKGGAPDG